MFFKRSLFVLVGVLLFIGGFLLKFHHTDAKIESLFRQDRIQYGVEGMVLTAHQAPAPPPAPMAVPASSAALVPSAPGNPAPASTPASSTILGPMPPANSAVPESQPAPSAPPSPAPAPDTNGGPIMPPASTMVYPRESHRSSFFVLAAYDPAGTALPLADDETSGNTNPPPQKTMETTNPAPTAPTPAVPASNAVPASPGAATNEAPISAGASPTNAAPPRPVPVEASVIVLGYHQFTGPGVASRNIYSMSQEVFGSEMKYLHDNGYHVVPLADVVRFIKHEIGLPPNSVAITIDDGYKSVINYAAPVLKQYGYPWTFFIYPQFITRRESKGACDWPDLVALQAQGVDIECHSMTHPFLSHRVQTFHGSRHLLSPEEYSEFLTNETAGAKAILDHELNKNVKFFAYPYGDYNKMVEAAVVSAGFEAIFTVAGNPIHETTNLHRIGRYVITKPVEHLFASYLREGALSLAEADPAPGSTISNPRPVITAVLGFTGTLDPKSLETDVRDYGIVRHDFDPKTSTVRLYLPRDLIQSDVRVNIRVRDAKSGQMMVADWHFNYEPVSTPASPVHKPISSAPVAKPSDHLTNTAPVAEKGTPAVPVMPSSSAKTNSTSP